MNGEDLRREVTKRRPIDGGLFVAGCIIRSADMFRVEFLKYRNSGGIAGRVSPREIATIAPDLVKALRTDGGKLKAYVIAEDERAARFAARPGGSVGSSRLLARPSPERRTAGMCDCNGAAGLVYAQPTAFGASGLAGAGVPGSVPCTGAVGGDGGCGRETRAGARDRGWEGMSK